MPPKPSAAKDDPTAKRIVKEQRMLALDILSIQASPSPGPCGHRFTTSDSPPADSAAELNEAAAASHVRLTSQTSAIRKGARFTLAEAFQRVKPAAVASLLGRSNPNQELGEELERAR